ncbi:MAG: hypothetical protein ACPGYV_06615 [Phycisphaeraceae bacterium]
MRDQDHEYDHDTDHDHNPVDDFDTPIDAPNTNADPTVPAGDDRLSWDVTCRGCGYNLRGHRFDAGCSECGLPVFESLHREELAGQDPDWIKSLRNGMTTLLAGICVMILVVLVGFVIGFNSAMNSANQGPPAPGAQPTADTGILLFSLASTLVSAAIFGAAIWLTTAPEPNPPSPQTTRVVARWGFAIAFTLSVIGSLVGVMMPPGQSQAGTAASYGLNIVNTLATCVAVPAILLYLRSLAERIPNPGLASQTLVVTWGLTICFIATLGVTMISAIIAGAPGSSPSQATVGIFGAYGCLVGLGFLVFGIWWLVLMCRYQSQFSLVHRNALNRSDNLPQPAGF